jgi:uncharacterized protein with HEPN domain
MIPNEIDRLRHMRDAASSAVEFAAGKDRAVLGSDRMFQFAIVRAVEIIGEAAAHVPDAMRAAHPEIRWGDIVGMRNRLVHGYFDVDLDIVWETVDVHLPALIAALDAWIPTLTPPPAPTP